MVHPKTWVTKRDDSWLPVRCGAKDKGGVKKREAWISVLISWWIDGSESDRKLKKIHHDNWIGPRKTKCQVIHISLFLFSVRLISSSLPIGFVCCLVTMTHLDSFSHFLILLPLSFTTILLVHYSEEHHKGKGAVPETTGTSEGSASRNIQRKTNNDPHQKDKKQGGGGGGKGKWDALDDGSMP